MPCDLHVRRVDPRRGRRYISPRSEQPERPSQGTAGRDPWESRKVDWAHLLVRLGQLTSCAGGEAREAPKPNERVYGPETKTAVRGCSEHLSPRGRWWLEASASGEPEVPRVLLSARFRTDGRRTHPVELPSRSDRGGRHAPLRGRGYRGARIEDIASEVGVAKGTVFLHFGSKEGLFLAAYGRPSGRSRLARRPGRGPRPGLLGRPFLLAPPDRGARGRGLGPQQGRDDRSLRHRPRSSPADRPAHAGEDPYGTLEFVEFGVERGEIRGTSTSR